MENLINENNLIKFISNKRFSIVNNLSLYDIFSIRLEPLESGEFKFNLTKSSDFEINLKFEIKKSAKLTLFLAIKNLTSIVDEDSIMLEVFNDQRISHMFF